MGVRGGAGWGRGKGCTWAKGGGDRVDHLWGAPVAMGGGSFGAGVGARAAVHLMAKIKNL